MDSLLHAAIRISSTSLAFSLDAATKVAGLASDAHNDTMVIKSWIVMGSILRLEGKNEEAFALFQRSLQLAEKVKYVHGICQSQLEGGTILYKQGQYEKSADLFRKSLDLAHKGRFFDLEASSLNYIGKYLHTTGRFDESVDFYKRALETYKMYGDSLNSVSVLLNLGKTYIIDSDFYMALKCFLEAFKICKKSSDYSSVSDVCSNLGSIYLTLDQPEISLEYHRKALYYRVLLNTPEGLASSCNNVGKVYLVKNDPDSALFYFGKSLKYCEQIAYLKGKVKALANIGKVFILKSEYLKAKLYLQQSKAIAEKSGYAAGVAEASLELGNVFLSLHQTDSAKIAFENSIIKAKLTNLTEIYHDAYWGLYQCNLLKKNHEKALEYYRNFAQAERKMREAETSARLSELRITFESEKKEDDNALLRKDNEIKEITIKQERFIILLFIFALALTLLLIILLYTRFNNKRKANERLAILNKKVVKQNKELEKLNKELENANREKDKVFSIITHELRNPLYWFQNLTEMLSLKFKQMPPEKVQKTLGALDESAKNAFHLMDNLLHWSRSRLNRITPSINELSLKKLVLESSRMFETIINQKKIQLIIQLPDQAFIKADEDLFMCVVRNLLSNAIKYTPENGVVKIYSAQEKSNYTIFVADSGIGIDSKRRKTIFKSDKETTSLGLMNEKGSGFGLKLCKEFVEMNGGKIWIADNTDHGTCFCFTVPAASQKE
ncbi:MAG: tetratricopeptide repeat-containing sensor histidine kinase [Prolixibacteraceae bacterium]